MHDVGVEYDQTSGGHFREPLSPFVEARGIREEWAQARAILQPGKKALAMTARYDPKTAVLPIGVIERQHHIRQLVTMFAGVTPIR